jgi:hypothetical protein
MLTRADAARVVVDRAAPRPPTLERQVRWVIDVAAEGVRRGLIPSVGLRFLAKQAAIRSRSLHNEARGVVADLRDLVAAARGGASAPGSAVDLLLLAHVDRLRPGGVIEVGLADLIDRLVRDAGAVVVRSRLGYRLRSRRARRVVSLEPIAAAPAVRFARHHTSVVLVADTWDKTWMARHLARSRATWFVTPYRWWVDRLPALRRTNPSRWLLFPWWVPDRFVADRAARTVLAPDVAVVGALGPMYDLRSWVAAHPLVATTHHASAHEAGAVRLDHGGYFALLASHAAHVVAFSEAEDMRVPVAKYVEVPASGALLIGARAHHLEEMGFRDGEDCILFEGREDFAAKVGAFLARPEDFVAVAARGLDLVRERHTTSARLRMLLALLDGDGA